MDQPVDVFRESFSIFIDDGWKHKTLVYYLERLLAWWWWSKKTEQELTEYMLPLTCILLYYYSSNLFYYYSGQKKKDQDFTTLKKYQDTWWRQYTSGNQEGNALWCQHDKTFGGVMEVFGFSYDNTLLLSIGFRDIESMFEVEGICCCSWRFWLMTNDPKESVLTRRKLMNSQNSGLSAVCVIFAIVRRAIVRQQ